MMKQRVASFDVFLGTGVEELDADSPRTGMFHVGDRLFRLRCSAGTMSVAGSRSKQELIDVAGGHNFDVRANSRGESE